jgi:hypothetical protein
MPYVLGWLAYLARESCLWFATLALRLVGFFLILYAGFRWFPESLLRLTAFNASVLDSAAARTIDAIVGFFLDLLGLHVSLPIGTSATWVANAVSSAAGKSVDLVVAIVTDDHITQDQVKAVMTTFMTPSGWMLLLELFILIMCLVSFLLFRFRR